MSRFLLILLTALCLHQAAFAQTTPAPTGPRAPTAPLAVALETLKQPDVVLLDVRTPEEFAAGHLTGAQNLDFLAPGFREKVAKLDKTKTYVLYCASGNRSGQANVLMEEAGFKKAVNAGAFKELKAAGLKTE